MSFIMRPGWDLACLERGFLCDTWLEPIGMCGEWILSRTHPGIFLSHVPLQGDLRVRIYFVAIERLTAYLLAAKQDPFHLHGHLSCMRCGFSLWRQSLHRYCARPNFV